MRHRLKRRIIDRLISLASWVPTRSAGLPLISVLAVAPAVYMLFFQNEAQAPAAALRSSRGAFRAEEADAVEKTLPDKDDPFSLRFDKMTSDLEAAAQAYPAQVAIYVKDLRRGHAWAYHADDLFPSASLIKVPIMIGVMEKVNRGHLSLGSRLRLGRRTRMGGSGNIKWKRDGTRFTVRKLLDKLIHNSDNTAMRILLDEVGMGYMQRQFPQMGLVYTEIYPDGLSLSSGRVRFENYTTAREMSMLFEKIYRGEMVNKFASELMLEILKGSRGNRARLAKTLPRGWEIAHKTGLLRRACHDSGIIFTHEGDYVITVLTGRNRGYSEAKNFITRIGDITYRHYKSDPELYAKAKERTSGNAR